jgi:hypothetical protein
MGYHSCISARPRESTSGLWLIYLIAVVVISVIWKPAHGLLDAVIVAVVAGWATALPARALRRLW